MPLKVAVLVPDGAADVALPELGGKTPLEAAKTPAMDDVARRGIVGTARTVPQGMTPGSDVANLSLLGYDPWKNFAGRGPIEAANLGVKAPDGWTIFRCNIVSVEDGRMLDYSAGHISNEEAARAVALLEEKLADTKTRFYKGKSYRNLMLLDGKYSTARCVPPHDITGELMSDHVPEGKGSQRLIELMERSKEVLASLSVPGDAMIWPWGQGHSPKLEPFEEKFGLRGAVISAVDLVNGLAVLADMNRIRVPGATGYIDTDYAAKGRAAVAALDDYDMVYVHVEAPDEASHMGSVEEKVKALERFDSKVVEPVLHRLSSPGTRLMVCPDHPTLISTRTHDASPVPFAICGEGLSPEGANSFSERAGKRGDAFDEGHLLMLSATGIVPFPAPKKGA